jgi:hypothetical protein
MDKLVRSFLTEGRTLTMSVEQVVAYIEKDSTVTSISVKNDPPVIFVSMKPAILLQLEGSPVKAEASKEQLEFVLNANYPLFFDKNTNNYYLFDGLEWRKGSAAYGPWTFTGSLPKSMNNLTKDSNWVQLKSIIPAVTKASSKMPDVLYAEQPAELILFEGEPAYKNISGTTLKFATNTNSDIFYCGSDKQYYYLTAGRWFSAPGFTGPWTFATSKLPADFTKIPATSPAAEILTFVPGTDQAKDAVMIAQIPVTATVNAAEAAKQVKIVYSGEPQFKPIDSTKLYYAVNTSDKVIKVSGTEYYACVQGIWFFSNTPNGPWQTATSVPQVIYAMPPSSPVYNVTYVTQYVTTTGYVQSSYTSGYMGVYVAGTPSGVIIISGTGYYHPPYYYYPPYGYPYCYHYYPMTYGAYAYKPYPYGGVAYKSSYNPYTGTYARSATAYGPYGSVTGAQAYNPYTGTYARGASASTAYGSRSAAQAYNPYTGNSAATRQGSSPYGQWGTSAVSNGSGQWAQTGHATTSQGTVAGVQTSSGASAAAASGNNGGSVAKTGSGDVYAAKDGNVYKKTDDGWNQYGNGGWSSASKAQTQNATTQANATAAKQGNAGTTQQAAAASQGFNSQQMNQDYQNRQRGNTQTHQYNNRSTSSGSRSAGGRSMGRGR